MDSLKNFFIPSFPDTVKKREVVDECTKEKVCVPETSGCLVVALSHKSAQLFS